MSNVGIYVIENTANGKKYVGQSYDVIRRFRVHKLKLRKGEHPNTHLQGAWNQYGENSFAFSVIENCSIEVLNDREMFWIEKLQTLSPNGYNLTLGGDGNRGYRFSDSTKSLLSEIKKASPSCYWQGKHLSDEHKQKIRDAALNMSEDTRQKIGEASRRVMSDPDIRQRMIQHQNNKSVYCRELDAIYYSVSEAARQIGLSAGNISKVCRGLIKKTGGYHFTFVDVPRDTSPNDGR